MFNINSNLTSLQSKLPNLYKILTNSTVQYDKIEEYELNKVDEDEIKALEMENGSFIIFLKSRYCYNFTKSKLRKWKMDRSVRSLVYGIYIVMKEAQQFAIYWNGGK